jgi:hypothetical protein
VEPPATGALGASRRYRRPRLTRPLGTSRLPNPSPPTGVYTADITFDDLKARFNQVGGRVGGWAGSWWVLALRSCAPRGLWPSLPGQLPR